MNQKFDRDHLTQTQAAQLMGCDRRTLQRWENDWRERGCFPRNQDGSYHLFALHWWRVANKIQIDCSAQLNARLQRRR